MTAKELRLKVYNKYDGRCGYCGNEVKFKDFQVDHIIPKRSVDYIISKNKDWFNVNDFSNLMPSCRRCNHYKRASSLDNFRLSMKTLHDRITKNYINKVAIDYGIISSIVPFDGKFYFEKQ